MSLSMILIAFLEIRCQNVLLNLAGYEEGKASYRCWVLMSKNNFGKILA